MYTHLFRRLIDFVPITKINTNDKFEVPEYLHLGVTSSFAIHMVTLKLIPFLKLPVVLARLSERKKK